MDPTQIFPTEVAELIFKNLSGKELLKCSLVSPDWYNFIGSSFVCMKNWKLGMRTDWMSFDEDDKQMLVTGRRYHSVLISDGAKVFDFVYDVMKSRNQWKSVEVFCMSFRTTLDFVNFVETFETTVEVLVLERVMIQKPDAFENKFDFKHLKLLKTSYCDETVMKMFKQCKSIEVLKLFKSVESMDDHECIVKMIQSHKKLRKLQIGAELCNAIFSANANDLQLQLDELSIINHGHSVDNTLMEKSFLSFLTTQMESLKVLNLSDWFGVDVMQMVFELKVLKELQIYHLPMLDWNTLSLNPSASIESLDIVTTDIRHQQRIKTILKSVPNLKHIRMREIDEEIAKFMSENLKHLQTIYLVHDDSDLVEKFLPNVRCQ